MKLPNRLRWDCFRAGSLLLVFGIEPICEMLVKGWGYSPCSCLAEIQLLLSCRHIIIVETLNVKTPVLRILSFSSILAPNWRRALRTGQIQIAHLIQQVQNPKDHQYQA